MDNIENLLKQILDAQNKTNERLDRLESITNNLQSTTSNLDTTTTSLESQTSESTQILKALEHNAEVHKAELDNLTHAVAKLSGDVKSIKKEVVKGSKAYDFLENFNKYSSSED